MLNMWTLSILLISFYAREMLVKGKQWDFVPSYDFNAKLLTAKEDNLEKVNAGEGLYWLDTELSSPSHGPYFRYDAGMGMSINATGHYIVVADRFSKKYKENIHMYLHVKDGMGNQSCLCYESEQWGDSLQKARALCGDLRNIKSPIDSSSKFAIYCLKSDGGSQVIEISYPDESGQIKRGNNQTYLVGLIVKFTRDKALLRTVRMVDQVLTFDRFEPEKAMPMPKFRPVLMLGRNFKVKTIPILMKGDSMMFEYDNLFYGGELLVTEAEFVTYGLQPDDSNWEEDKCKECNCKIKEFKDPVNPFEQN